MATEAITGIANDYSSLVAKANDADGLPQRVDTRFEPSSKGGGEVAEVEKFMKSFLNKVVAQRNDYLLEIEAIGFDKILDGNRLSRDRSLAESRILLQQARRIVTKYRQQTEVLLETVTNDIRLLNLSERAKRDMVAGYEKGLVASRAQIDAIWDLEFKTLEEFESIFALLSTRKGAWAVSNGQLLFADDSDLRSYNSSITAIQQYVSKQQALQKQSADAAIATLERVGRELKTR